MKLDLANAQAMGNLIVEGVHKPFRALACALRPSVIRIGKKKKVEARGSPGVCALRIFEK